MYIIPIVLTFKDDFGIVLNGLCNIIDSSEYLLIYRLVMQFNVNR
jgi:hypothetical protein